VNGDLEEERALKVDHCDSRAVARADDRQSTPRDAVAAEVRRPQNPVGLLEDRNDVAVPPRVIAERHDVGTDGQETRRDLRRQPHPVGCVLAVDDAEVDVELVAELRQP
jgi:hypothetical protein